MIRPTNHAEGIVHDALCFPSDHPWQVYFEGQHVTSCASLQTAEAVLDQLRAERRRRRAGYLAILLIFALLGAAVGWTVLNIAATTDPSQRSPYQSTDHK